jgi:CubicO group peptidase (beta-lactamase class C family)
MTVRRTLYIIESIVFFILGIEAGGQNKTNCYEFADSVSQLSLEEKVAMILLPVDENSYLVKIHQEPGPQNLLIANNWLLDGIHGFRTEHESVPFPDTKAIDCINDPHLLGHIKEDLLFHAAISENRAIIASHRYLFQNSDYHYLFAPKQQGDYTLWVFTGDKNEATEFPVYSMPANLLAKNKALSMFRFDYNLYNTIEPWTDRDKRADSFEAIMHEGGFFLTRNFTKDYLRLLRAYRNKTLVEEELTTWCEKIMEAFIRSGRRLFPAKEILPCWAEYVRRMAFEHALHLFRDRETPFIPSDLSSVHIGIISDVSAEMTSAFQEMTNNHLPLSLEKSNNADFIFWLINGHMLNDSVIVSRLSEIKEMFPDARIALMMADPGNYFRNHSKPLSVDAIYTGSSDWPIVWKYLAQAAFSGIEIQKAQDQEVCLGGLQHLSVHEPRTRLKFGIPEEVAMRRDILKKIDELMSEAIEEKATPGGQILVARDGIVIWNKSYGYHTYAKKESVQKEDVYDLASVTKISATVPSLMKLFGQNRWSLNDSLGQFFPKINTTDKSGITMKELLLHESGLPSFIPFYLNAVDREKLNGSLFRRHYSRRYSIKLDDYVYLNRTVQYRNDVFSTKENEIFSVPVAQNRFMNVHYLDSIKNQVVTAPMRTRHKYLYSDLGFYFLGKVVSCLSGQPLNIFAAENFYGPMGMTNTTFLPSFVFQEDKIVPTEDDEAFRKQLLHGWVHDPGAAMMGGVAGHAGLFSNATDLGKLMQMYLNGGTYGGKYYIEDGVVEKFTQTYNNMNRRGLGFDKPESDTTRRSPASRYVSPSSFGHSGFTGTFVWVDPQTGIVYIFLSNRVYPHQYNKKLIECNLRTKIQDIIYRSVFVPEKDETLEFIEETACDNEELN